jgi:nitrogen fixation NifU-like protein
MYSPQVLAALHHPGHAGTLDHPDALARCENPACGDVLQLALRCQAGRVAAVRFQVQGCVPAIACGEAIAVLAEGKTPDEVLRLTPAELVAALGGLPAGAHHAAALALATLAAAVAQLSASGRAG